MKVIKASLDLATWKKEITCHGCQSVLEVCSEDISFTTTFNKQWQTTCCLCDTVIFFDSKDLPVLVQNDIRKHRYIRNRDPIDIK